ARKGVRLVNLIEGGAQEGGKRAGTENVAAAAAMAAALKETAGSMAETAPRLRALRDRLIAGLREIPHSALNGDAEKRLPGNVNFCFEGIEGESLLLLLDDRGICASSGSACTSGSLDPSHVLLAIGRVHDVAHGSLRLTLGEDATEEDVEYLIRNVKEVVEYLRGFSPIWRDLVQGKAQFIL
ncbi:MAG: aminotransferase class V-fold PLP-dependent enzyme, partial [Oscillospiraceae bacterium]|nr:aminotransferase class V-fold PLP-dependent enzyme [Oscillospiraceae bacterium]